MSIVHSGFTVTIWEDAVASADAKVATSFHTYEELLVQKSKIPPPKCLHFCDENGIIQLECVEHWPRTAVCTKVTEYELRELLVKGTDYFTAERYFVLFTVVISTFTCMCSRTEVLN